MFQNLCDVQLLAWLNYGRLYLAFMRAIKLVMTALIALIVKTTTTHSYLSESGFNIKETSLATLMVRSINLHSFNIKHIQHQVIIHISITHLTNYLFIHYLSIIITVISPILHLTHYTKDRWTIPVSFYVYLHGFDSRWVDCPSLLYWFLRF